VRSRLARPQLSSRTSLLSGHASIVPDISPDLRALADKQFGVVTRRQALHSGMTERQLKTATQPRGDWVVVRRGAYAERWEWDAADAARRHLMKVVAVSLVARRPYVLSHSSAGVVHALDCRPHWRELVHVSHPGVLGGRTEGGVKHHPAAVPDEQQTVVGRLEVTSLARTAVDIAREYGIEDGVIACDQVLRREVSRSELYDVLTQMWSWPNVTRARAAVRLADPGAENLAESLARMLVIELGFGTPTTQVWIEDGGRRVRVDMILNGHIFEFDGKVKYTGEFGESTEVLWQEKQREDWLRSLGFGISRIVWSDLFGPARRAALKRLAGEYVATQARRGAHRVS
jgi:hypothetical protein